VAEYLIKSHGFLRLYLLHDTSVSHPSYSPSIEDAQDIGEKTFTNIESLLEFVTKQWNQRWVTTDVFNESVLENLLRRPSFILVSVDAPVSLRWNRFRQR